MSSNHPSSPLADQGVLLLNLGSPDSLAVSDVRSYLREFLMDGRVIDTKAWKRWLIVNAFILPFRPRQSAKAYARIWTEEGSPLLVTSERVRQALDHEDLPVSLAMNYGKPTIASALKDLRDKGVKDLFIIPLYPHYAMSSWETVVAKAFDVMDALDYRPRSAVMQPFYRDEDYLDALVESARPYLEKPHDALLFSFHGIPEKHLRKTDPTDAHCLRVKDCCDTCSPAHATCYRHQCRETVRAFIERAGLDPSRCRMSFQSRLGRDPWLQPYTDEMLETLPSEGVKRLLVICPAFVSDCLETLEEIAMEGKEEFLEAGGEFFEQIPCLNQHPAWISLLRKRIDRWSERPETESSLPWTTAS